MQTKSAYSGYLAIFFLYGLLCFQTITYFLHINWQRQFSIALYVIATTWLAALLFKQESRWWKINVLDQFVLIFWLTVLGSIFFKQEAINRSIEYLTYIPFMAILPYLCGRLLDRDQLIRFKKLVIFFGFLFILLAVIDRLFFGKVVNHNLRWPFFGYDHGRLMVGSLWALCLLALGNSFKTDQGGEKYKASLIYYLHMAGGMWLIAILIWTTARGWLIASIFSFLLMSILNKNQSRWVTTKVIILTGMTVIFFYWLIPQIEPHSNPSNISYVTKDDSHSLKNASLETSSADFKVGHRLNVCPNMLSLDSASVRKMFYKESIDLFLAHPVFGIGATNYGTYSCWQDVKSHPHSTVLQAFVELGIFGGVLLLTIVVIGFFRLSKYAFTKQNGSYFGIYIFALASLAIFFLADQVYGNYFMATGSWLFLGVAARFDFD